jgi:hypothetical protein
MKPISLYGFLRPRPERADEVRQLLTSFVAPTRLEPGNLQYHLHEHDDGRFFLAEPVEGYFNTMVSAYPEGGTAGDDAPSNRVSLSG